MGLVGLEVTDEEEGVVVLNLLHGGLGGQGVLDDLEFVEFLLASDRLTWVFGVSSLSLCDWTTEEDRGALASGDCLIARFDNSANFLSFIDYLLFLEICALRTLLDHLL